MSTELQLAPKLPLPIAPRVPTPAEILQAVVDKGISAENVEVCEKLMTLVRDQRKEDAKIAFYRAFAQLRRAAAPIYADKQVPTKTGIAFSYCSPQEIKDNLEPLMQRFGFSTITGQELHAGIVTVSVTVFHEEGHAETRSFTVRVSPGNQLTTPTQLDAGASTAAERHCLIKLFGLRTRVSEDDDPRLVGETISQQDAANLRDRVLESNSNEVAFLKFCGVTPMTPVTLADYERIPMLRFAAADEMLRKKEAKR